MSSKQRQKKTFKGKTFPVPFALKNIDKNLTFDTKIPSNNSSEEIINRAFKLHSQGNILEAAKYYQYCLDQGYNDPRVLSNYGIICRRQGNKKLAKKLYLKSIKLYPNYSDSYSNLSFLLKDDNDLERALEYIEKAIYLSPKNAIHHLNLGWILKDLGKLNGAELSTRKAIELNPNFAIAHANLGSILRDLGKLRAAEISQRKAIAINPDYAEAHSNLGSVLSELGNLREAELSCRKAIKINPNFANAYYNLGNILRDLGKSYDAINFYLKAINLNDKLSQAKSALINCKGNICDWSDQKTQKIWLQTLGIEGSSIYPLGLFYYEDNPLKQLQRAKNLYKERYYTESKKIEPLNNQKIHVGYFSSDFRAHPTMYLIASILKLHDKSKFKIYLYSFAPKEDKYTEIAKQCGCVFKNIKEYNDDEVVRLSRKDKLDIAIDLMGYIEHHRMKILSHRVAPIQINYLGYPGTLGADTIEYLIADKILIPKENEKFYTEKIVIMPSCYQCNDNKKEICKEPISRKEFRLPEKEFVFTCFCANKKITPKEFDIWMRLLKEIKGSVLWLYKSNQYSIENLMKEAEKRNIDPTRLIFADYVPLDKHLARHSLGDLGLDTFNYNGHTTTSDALWAGLPVLTKIGKSFAARVSASILNSIGLTELITSNEQEYEEKALNIARNPEKLISLKSKLAKFKKTSPLYNSELFTKNLESKFMELYLK